MGDAMEGYLDRRQTIPERMGFLLHTALQERGMTQAELARAMGITEKHVSKMVNGESGAWAMFEFAAHTLRRKWTIDLADEPPSVDRGTE